MNPYYNPKEMGLEIVTSIDYSDGNYIFDYRVVWVEVATGNLFTARDSGCSCPTPFEDFTSIDTLDKYYYSDIRMEAVDKGRRNGYDGGDISKFIESLPR